jgi:hypothetical protein
VNGDGRRSGACVRSDEAVGPGGAHEVGEVEIVGEGFRPVLQPDTAAVTTGDASTAVGTCE